MAQNFLPKDLPARLRAAGLTVVEIDGWETRGRPASTGGFDPVGVLNHHTGASALGWLKRRLLAYCRFLFRIGRPDLPAPLCQLSLGRDGTVYVGAAGRANHAGTAKSSGSVAAGDGNSLYGGIEWQLSGTEKIPAVMYAAGATVNAVLLDIFGSSVQAVSCHYQTSVTGKWDIGDPAGIAFGDKKVLDVAKFRKAVQAEKDRLNPPVTRAFSMVSVQFTAMQFSDSPNQQAADVRTLFTRGKDILGGTEAGASGNNFLPTLLPAAAAEFGYQLHRVQGEWLAVSRDLAGPTCGWTTGYVPVLGSTEGKGKHSDRGIVWATFTHPKLGEITVGVAHYLTNGRKPGDPNYQLNRRMAAAIGDWARDKGRGKAIVLYAGDQNILDRTGDTFFGSPLTSAWDELDRYENTGHGNIDVIASYDADSRVQAMSIRALDDTELHLNTDHFLVQATYQVRHL